MGLSYEKQFEVGQIVGALAQAAVNRILECNGAGCTDPACRILRDRMPRAIAETFIPAFALAYEVAGMPARKIESDLARAVLSVPDTHPRLVEMAERLLDR